MFEEGSMARDKRTGTGSARDLMDMMRRLLRLRKSLYVVFENAKVVMEVGYGLASM